MYRKIHRINIDDRRQNIENLAKRENFFGSFSVIKNKRISVEITFHSRKIMENSFSFF